jgi:hypothetical protein
VLAFVLLLLVAHYGSCSRRLLLVYAAATVAVTDGSQRLFSTALQVPLPAGTLL